jgi:hypothetical protein
MHCPRSRSKIIGEKILEISATFSSGTQKANIGHNARKTKMNNENNNISKSIFYNKIAKNYRNYTPSLPEQLWSLFEQ